MPITLQDLKNTMKVAKHTGEMECFTASIKNEHREFSIIVSYYPASDPKNDIYPYWTINMKEESLFKVEHVQGKDLATVRDIYNRFTSQGIGESYLENNLINY